MTTPVWPDRLNYLVERGTFKLVQNEPQLRSEFDAGPARARRRFTRQVAQMTFSLVFTSEEFEVFKSFWTYKLLSGVSWFHMMIWSGDAYRLHKVRFVEPYSSGYYAHNHMKVSGTVEALELSVLSEGVGEVLGVYTSAQLVDLENIINYTVNEHWETTWP